MANNLLQLFPTEPSTTSSVSTRVLLLPNLAPPVNNLPAPRYTTPAPFPSESALAIQPPIASANSESITASSNPDSAPTQESKPNKKALLGKIYAALLMLLACAVGFYEFTDRVFPLTVTHASQLQNSAPALDAQTVVVTANDTESQTPAASGISSKPAKPSPSHSLNSNPTLPQSNPTLASTQPHTSTQPIITSTQLSSPPLTNLRQATNAPTPAFAPRPTPASQPALAQSASAQSGLLHYQGQPIPYRGIVTFTNLPAQRLKYTYDHSSWQISLLNNPDGTRKAVQLTSIKSGLQTNCDLGWEIVQ